MDYLWSEMFCTTILWKVNIEIFHFCCKLYILQMQLKLYVPQMQNKKLKDFPHQDKNFQFMFSST